MAKSPLSIARDLLDDAIDGTWSWPYRHGDEHIWRRH